LVFEEDTPYNENPFHTFKAKYLLVDLGRNNIYKHYSMLMIPCFKTFMAHALIIHRSQQGM